MRRPIWLRRFALALGRKSRPPVKAERPFTRGVERLEDRTVPSLGQTVHDPHVFVRNLDNTFAPASTFIERAKDVDFFAADLVAGEYLTVDIDSRRTDQDLVAPYDPVSGSNGFNSFLQIFHSYTGVLAHVVPVAANDNATWEHAPHDVIADSRITLRVDHGGRWYFGVSRNDYTGYSPISADPAAPGADITDQQYRIQVRVSPNNAPVAYSNASFTGYEDNTLHNTLTSSDADGDARFYHLWSHGLNGTVSLGTNGSFSYTPNANFHGWDRFQFYVTDTYGAASGVADAWVYVTPINDAPSFAGGGNRSVLEDSGWTPFHGWASNISPGPNEAGQSVWFEVISLSNPGLFSGLTVDSAGTLWVLPAANAYGDATVGVRARDNGGTAHGGVDASPVYYFTLSVVPVNDRPSFASQGDVAVNEDSGPATFPGWVTGRFPGPNEGHQSVEFDVVYVGNPGLFAAQPTVDGAGTLRFTPAADAYGYSSIGVRARDNGGTANGGVDVGEIQYSRIYVTAVNDAPRFTPGTNQAVDEDAGPRTVTGWATGIAAGPPNEAGQGVGFEVTGNTNPGLFLNPPVVASDGTLTYTPAANAFGWATISVRAVDNGGTANGGQNASAPKDFTITVNPVNDAPVARDDAATVNEDSAVDVNVLANDSAGPANEASQSLSVTHLNGVAVAVDQVVATAHGTVKLLGTGQVQYTPAANYNGGDSFTYTVKDDGTPPLSASAGGTVTINPVNDAPVATGGFASVPEDADPGVAIDLTPLVSDVETPDANLLYEIVAGPAAAAGTLTATATGVYTFRPAANYNGPASFTYRVRDNGDPNGAANTLWSEVRTVTIQVTPVNDRPTADNDGGYSVAEGDTLDVAAPGVLDGDADVDGQAVSAVLLTPPAHGSVTLQADGSFRYVHDGGETTSDSFTYRAFDGTAYSDPATVSITVTPVNDAPVARNDAYAVAEDGTLTVAAAGILANDTDAEGTALTVAAPRPVSGPSYGILTVNADGSFTYKPNPNFNGTDSFTYRATDGTASSDLVATVQITVAAVNDAPTASPADRTTAEDTALDIDLWTLVADVETADENLTFTVAGATNGTVTLIGGHVARFTPAANYHGPAGFTYTVKDTGDGPSSAITVADTPVGITVTAVNDAPVANPTSLTTAEDAAVEVDLWTLVSDLETADADLTFAVGGAVGGTVELVDSHTARFTPAANHNGPASFAYTATDTADGASPAITVGGILVAVTVTPVNDAPVATTADLTTNEDTLVEVDLWQLVADVETADADLTFAVGGATNGTVTLVDGHIARFTPAANYHGPAGFTYTVKDTGDGASGAVTVGPVSSGVTVSPVNDAPVTSTAALTTAEDTAVEIDLRTLVADIETADAGLTFSVDGAVNGSVSLVSGHIARFTPAANYNGSASFAFGVTDTGDGTSGAITVGNTQVTVTVDPVNDAPVANPASLTTNEDAAIEIDLWTLVSDVETGDADLTFTVGGATNGSVQLMPDGHTARFLPAADYQGPASFTYDIKDAGDGSSAAITVGGTTVGVQVNNLVDLSGRVFVDRDNDGAYEPSDGDAGLFGVAVQVWNAALTAKLGETTTAPDGTYRLNANLPAGNYKIVEVFAELANGLLDGRETAGGLGGDVVNSQDSNAIGVSIDAGNPDAGGYLFAEIRPSRVQGLVWVDFNNDGEVNYGEKAVAGAALTLTGTDDRGNPVSRTMATDAQGIAEFLNVRPGTYALTETQPGDLIDGVDALGTVNGAPTGTVSNDQFGQIVLAGPGSDAVNYNFGERPPADGQAQPGQTASIAFWQNKHGQALLAALNGGPAATQLANWLADTFPNMYGPAAGPNNLAGKTNADVAKLYVTLFKRTGQDLPNSGPVKLDAQVLATALSAYVTNSTLAGNTAAAYGFTVSAYGLGTSTVNVGASGAAFGVADNTTMTVLDILLAVNAWTVNGILYDLDGDGVISNAERSLRALAHDVFTAINQ